LWCGQNTTQVIIRHRVKILFSVISSPTRYDYNLTIMKTPMWVDYDVPNWFLTSKNFYRSPFSKWPPQYHTNSTLQCWIFTAHILCRVLAAILKMADISKILKTQNCSSNGDLSLCQILCLYHYLFRSYQH
jgi:hypothetical protein